MISFHIGAEAGEDTSWHGKPDNWSRAGEQLSDSAVFDFSGEDSLASNKAGAFLP
jgi:hypothetical protein